MVELRIESTVTAPIEKVFDIYVDPSNEHRMLEDTTTEYLDRPSIMAVGNSYEQVVNIKGNLYRSKVTWVESVRPFTHVVNIFDDGSNSINTLKISSDGMKTKVTWTSKVEFRKWQYWLLSPFYATLLTKRMTKEIERLNQYIALSNEKTVTNSATKLFSIPAVFFQFFEAIIFGVGIKIFSKLWER